MWNLPTQPNTRFSSVGDDDAVFDEACDGATGGNAAIQSRIASFSDALNGPARASRGGISPYRMTSHRVDRSGLAGATRSASAANRCRSYRVTPPRGRF